jgi:hypothetical protein
MKYSKTEGAVLEMDPEIEKGQFGMQINAKSFSILVDGIYSNKIKAVIRELSCNAADSHTEACNKNPIEIHLPTNTEPYFYVQDYGVGLNKEMFLKVFINFFESTKDTSNRYTGSLGIGAKSFFAYNTKSCTVETVKDGVKLIYNCFLENGMPSYAKMAEFETKEPNGVKIQFPVRKQDFEAFYNSSREVFKWFKQKPKFVGYQIEIEEDGKTLEGQGWYFSKYYSSDAILVMGNIGYNIENGEIGLDKYSDFIRSPVVIEAKLGEVEFEAAREGLSYTQKTVAFLQKKFKEIKTELHGLIEDKVKGCSNHFQASLELNSVMNDLSYNLKRLVDRSSIKFNGKEIKTQTKIKIDGVTFIRYEYSSWRKTPRKGYSVYVNFDKDINFFLNDLKVGQHGRVMAHTQNTQKDSYLFILNEEEFPNCKKELLEALGATEEDFKKTSELEKVSKTTTNNKNKLTPLMKYEYNHRVSQALSNVDVDITKTKGVYVVRNGYQVHNNLTGELEKNTCIQHTLDLFGDDTDVYAVTKSGEQELIDAGWVELKDHIISLIKKNETKFIDKATNISFPFHRWSIFLHNCTHIAELRDFVDEVKELRKQYNDGYTQGVTNTEIYSILEQIIPKKLKSSIKQKEDTLERTKTRVELMMKAYPLLTERVINKQELVHYYKGKQV